MKKIVLSFAPLLLLAKSLDLPVEYDPFAGAKKLVKKSPAPLHRYTKETIPQMRLDLIGIFGDKAYINGKFYTIGQNVYGYKLIDIAQNYVVLQKGRIKKVLPIVAKKILKMER